ncbi:MAG TPA: sugar phosphate isomerase/epimerase [Sedimentisphaerales bacterium]|nr:sugar phosphate isomerase/epimerase [Sedimentisphaerales bacterium]HRS12739.1 sugar phosphate isomerase/epimerase [Sedimentisphaerales bacterium]HRV49345.1 sugar phosphate isomerase/epimerase [Sedimentisphaerales bacterium]
MTNEKQAKERRTISRRELLGGAAAAAALAMAPGTMVSHIGAQPMGKPNSNFNGVQIGTITYSFRDLPGTAEDILQYVVRCGISSIELMGEPVEQYAGVPAPVRGRRDVTDEQRKAMEKSREAQLQWRLSAPMEKFQALRKMYNDAGVNIHIVKFGNIGDGNMTDGEIDYYFNVAKALGARGITRELSEEAAKRLGPIADRHKIMIGFHNHTQMTPTTYDGPILSYGKYLGINFDIGHYVAGTNQSPIPIIEKFHDRILSLHLKDRKVNNGPNMPFGQGDTPVALVLQLLKREKWTFPADIELEYPIPQGSDSVAETTKCVQFCRQALA